MPRAADRSASSDFYITEFDSIVYEQIFTNTDVASVVSWFADNPIILPAFSEGGAWDMSINFDLTGPTGSQFALGLPCRDRTWFRARAGHLAAARSWRSRRVRAAAALGCARTGLTASLHAGPGVPTIAASGTEAAMDFMLTEEQRQIRESIARISEEFGDDYWYHKDLNHEFPHEFSRAFAAAGWFGAIFPEDVGGAGLGMTEAAIIMQEVGRNGFNACSSLHMNMFGCQPIVKFGTKEQQRRFLPPIIAGTDRACFGVTEPDAGIDTTHIRTFAQRKGNRYVVNGRKVWTSSAQVANKILLLTRTQTFEDSPKRSAGMTLVLCRSRPVAKSKSARSRNAAATPSIPTRCSLTGWKYRWKTASARRAAGFSICCTG